MGQLNQFSSVNKYYSEYLELIDRYKDYKRHSLYCMYFNIDTEISVINSDTMSNYSSFLNGIRFNIYDMTPLRRFDPMTNSVQVDKNKTGQKFTGETRITTYTIKNPRKNDLVILPYDNQSNEIYRVSEINSSLSVKNTNKNFHFDLTLEYAPMKNLNDISVVGNYVYLPNLGIYLMKEIYIKYITAIEELNKLFTSYKFNETEELYYHIINDEQIVNFEINNYIYEFLNENNTLFSMFKRVPFGIKSKYNVFKYYNINAELQFNPDTEFEIDNTILNLIKEIKKYEQSTN